VQLLRRFHVACQESNKLDIAGFAAFSQITLPPEDVGVVLLLPLLNGNYVKGAIDGNTLILGKNAFPWD
jgi:hypothetical protein